MIKIIRHYYVSEPVYAWVRGLAKWDELSQGTYDLFVSLLTRSAWRYKINAYNDAMSPAYPLHSLWLRKLKANPECLTGLLVCDNKWQVTLPGRPGKCKYYWVDSNILRSFEALAFSPGKHCINLYTGEKARTNRALPTDIQKPSMYDKNHHLITSKLVADAINIISKQKVKINYQPFFAYISRLNEYFNKKYNLRIDNPTLAGRLVKNCRAGNLLVAHFNKFRSPVTGEIEYYKPTYKPLYTGRITEQFIGLQSCSRIMRKKLMQDMNYIDMDLQSAQLNCLYYLLPPSDVKNTLAKKMARIFSDAASLGLPKKLVKPFLYAYIFNAGRLNTRIASIKQLKQYCRKHKLLTNYDDFIAGLTIIKDATITLLSAIKKKPFPLINHAGVKLTGDDLNKLAQKKLDKFLRKNKATMLCFPREEYLEHAKDKILLAHYIQGVETYIIHSLTLAGSSDTYIVMSNQHDGIIIAGDKNAVAEQMSKINKQMNANFTLVAKSF
jgi:hypothetical protein